MWLSSSVKQFYFVHKDDLNEYKFDIRSFIFLFRIIAACSSRGFATHRMTVGTAATRRAVPSSFPPESSQQPSSAAWSAGSCWSLPSAVPANSTRCACLNAGEGFTRFKASHFLNLLRCVTLVKMKNKNNLLQVIWDPALQSGGRAAQEGGPAFLWTADCPGSDPTSWGFSSVLRQPGTHTDTNGLE